MTTKSQNIDDLLTPTTLNDFLISDPVSRQTLFDILNGTIPFPAMGRNGICLWGAHGTGKTTLAKLLPNILEQSGMLQDSRREQRVFVHENFFDLTACGSGQNSVQLLSDIRLRVERLPCYGTSGWHYEILDEADLLTANAQASLKSLMTEGRSTIFVLTSNNKGGLDAGVKDRCHLIEMNKAAPQPYVPIAHGILRKLELQADAIPDDQIYAMAKANRGSFRDFGTAVVTAANRWCRSTAGQAEIVVQHDTVDG